MDLRARIWSESIVTESALGNNHINNGTMIREVLLTVNASFVGKINHIQSIGGNQYITNFFIELKKL